MHMDMERKIARYVKGWSATNLRSPHLVPTPQTGRRVPEHSLVQSPQHQRLGQGLQRVSKMQLVFALPVNVVLARALVFVRAGGFVQLVGQADAVGSKVPGGGRVCVK